VVGTGPDGQFGTDDDLDVTPTDVIYDAAERMLRIVLADGLADGGYLLILHDAQATDLAGNALNGEWYGVFPTGNAVAGGNFVMTFTVTPTQILGLTPAIEATSSRTLNVEIAVSGSLAPATVTSETIRLVNGAGGGQQVLPDELVYDAAAGIIRLAFTGGVPDGQYVLTVSEQVLDVHGSSIDGEYDGATGLPSGDGAAGGDFVASFTIDSPARVISITPEPGQGVKAPSRVEITFSEPIASAYLDGEHFRVTGDGADDELGTADDILVHYSSITQSADGRTIWLNVADQMPQDTYHVQIIPATLPTTLSDIEVFTGGPADPAEWVVNGDAAFVDNAVQLTTSAVGQGGNLFYTPEIWTEAFRVQFGFRISSSSGRWGLVMGWAATDDVNALGDYTTDGGALMGFDGIAGITEKVYGVELDLSGEGFAWDPDGRHIGVIQNSAADHLATADLSSLYVNGSMQFADIQVVGGEIRVSIGGQEKLRYTIEDYEPFLGRLFFTASTPDSGAANEHVIDNVAIFGGLAATLPGVRGEDGLLVDAELTDGQALPSGDGIPGGALHTTFRSDGVGPKVISASPDSATLFREGAHTWIEITFDEDITEAQGADPVHYQVLRNFTEPVAVNLVVYDPATRTTRLWINDGQPLADGSYQVTVFGDGPNAIRDEAGNRLDGEFNGEDWPSGNDAEGGDFQYAFSVDASRPRVIATNPSDGGIFSAGSVHTLSVTYSESIPITEVTDRNNYRVRASGADGSFKEGNEYYVRLNYVAYDSIGRRATVYLNDGYDLGDETYQLKIYNTTMHDLAGNVLDGNENLLSRDNFVMTFTVDTSNPHVVASDPSAAMEYVTDPSFDHIDLLFDDDLLTVEAIDPANYRVLRSGNDGTFHDGNEVGVGIDHVQWDAGLRIASVYLDTSTPLPEDTYQLTAFAGASATVRMSRVRPSAQIYAAVLALDDGGWAVVDPVSEDLLILDGRGALVRTIHVGGAGGLVPEALNLGGHLSRLEDGTFLLADSTNDWLIFVRPDGTLATEYGTENSPRPGVIDVSLAQGGAGILYAVTPYAGGIAVIDNINNDLLLLAPSGRKLGAVNIGGVNGLVPEARGLGGGITELSDGTLAITDWMHTKSILFVDPSTGVLATQYGAGGILRIDEVAPGAAFPTTVMELADGTLAVLDFVAPALLFLHPDGTSDVHRGNGGVLELSSSVAWAPIAGITHNGNLFVVNTSSRRIEVYRETGAPGSVGLQDRAGNILESNYLLSFTFDNSGPVMVDADPAPDGYSREYVSMIEVWLNEALDPLTANDAANYEIRGQGANGIFGDTDDVLYDFTPHYTVDPAGAAGVQLTLWSPLEDGAYQVTLVGETSIQDEAGNHLNDGTNTEYAFTVDTLAPSAAALTVNGGRSGQADLRSLSIEFDEAVRGDLAVEDLTVTRTDTGQPVELSGAVLDYQPAAGAATWTFEALVLTEGAYTATLSTAGLTDVAGNPMAAENELGFQAMPGDASGDGVVNDDDLSLVLANWSAGPVGDLTGDGVVNDDDLSILLANWSHAAGSGADGSASASAAQQPAIAETQPSSDSPAVAPVALRPLSSAPAAATAAPRPAPAITRPISLSRVVAEKPTSLSTSWS